MEPLRLQKRTIIRNVAAQRYEGAHGARIALVFTRDRQELIHTIGDDENLLRVAVVAQIGKGKEGRSQHFLRLGTEVDGRLRHLNQNKGHCKASEYHGESVRIEGTATVTKEGPPQKCDVLVE